MLGVLQAIINGQQPDMRAIHKLHELIVAGDLSADVSLETLACWLDVRLHIVMPERSRLAKYQLLWVCSVSLVTVYPCLLLQLLPTPLHCSHVAQTCDSVCAYQSGQPSQDSNWYRPDERCKTAADRVYALQRNIRDNITQDKNLDSDVGMNLIQLLGSPNEFYGTKRRHDSCASASSNDSILSGRCILTTLFNRLSCFLLFIQMLAVLQSWLGYIPVLWSRLILYLVDRCQQLDPVITAFACLYTWHSSYNMHCTLQSFAWS